MSTAQRISLVIVPLVLCAAAFGMVRWKHETDFRPLYTSLAPEDASALAQKMREAGIEYRLDETGATISVASGRIAEARLALAGAGLPRTGRIGFELFDRSNLGASDFTEQVNYRRALEGELERTVATLAEIEQARIHITFAKESVFLDSREKQKRPSFSNSGARVRCSLRVLRPSRILLQARSKIWLRRQLQLSMPTAAFSIVPGSPRTGDAAMADANLDYRHQVESDMNARINNALEPLLGAGVSRSGKRRLRLHIQRGERRDI